MMPIVDLNVSTGNQYAIRFPVELVRHVAGLESPAELRLANCRGTLSRVGDQYFINLEGFENETVATAFVPIVWEALAAVCLRRSTGFFARLDSPESSSGIVPSIESPTIYPMGPARLYLVGHAATIIVTTSATVFVPWLEEELNAGRDGSLYADESVRTAIELYSSLSTTPSVRVRLLSCFSAIEALAERRVRPKVAVDFLDKMKAELETLMSAYERGSAERDALNAIKGDLDFRSFTPIGTAIRDLVDETYSQESDEMRRERREKIGKVYACRSKLTHGNRVLESEIEEAYSNAREMLQAILARRFMVTI